MGAKGEYTLEELENLFGKADSEKSPTQNDEKTPPAQGGDDDKSKSVETTKAFSTRLKEKTEEAITGERERIAKTKGFDSYEAMMKADEKKLLEEKGIDENGISAIEEIVKKRIESDPRIKKLSEIESIQKEAFKQRQIEELKKEVGDVDTSRLPKEVLDLWEKGLTLTQAYFAALGSKAIVKNPQSVTSHLSSPNGGMGSNKKRVMTLGEKESYKFFNPEVSDEDINKILVED